MKSLQFWGSLNADGTLTVPPEIAAQVQGDQMVRVVLLLPAADEDSAWASLTAEQFLKGYAESDAIYDELSAG